MRIGLSRWSVRALAPFAVAASATFAAAENASDFVAGARSLLEAPALTHTPMDEPQRRVDVGVHFRFEWSQINEDIVAGDDDREWRFDGKFEARMGLDISGVSSWDEFLAAAQQPTSEAVAFAGHRQNILSDVNSMPVGAKIGALVVLELMAKGAKVRSPNRGL